MLRKGATGPQVERIQKAANRVLDKRELDFLRVEADGVLGRETIGAVHDAAFYMGFSEKQLEKIQRGTITDYAIEVLTQKRPRSEAMKKADRRRRDEAREARERWKGGPRLSEVVIHATTGGRKRWGGAADVMGQFVAPILHGKFALPIGSGKRTPSHNDAIGGSPTSDHLTTKLTTFARDFPTFVGETAARFLAKAFGWSSWSPNSFASFQFSVGGHRFSLQILWGALIGHDDHVHVGISLL